MAMKACFFLVFMVAVAVVSSICIKMLTGKKVSVSLSWFTAWHGFMVIVFVSFAISAIDYIDNKSILNAAMWFLFVLCLLGCGYLKELPFFLRQKKREEHDDQNNIM